MYPRLYLEFAIEYRSRVREETFVDEAEVCESFEIGSRQMGVRTCRARKRW